MKFKLVLNHEYMVKNKKTGLWSDRRNNVAYVKTLVDSGMDINIVGIIRPGEDNVLSVGMGGIGYLTELMDYALSETEKSEVVQQQLSDPKTDVITGLKFFDLTVNDFDLADIDMKEIDMNFLDISPFMSMGAINEMTCAGSLLIIMIGTNLMGITKIKVADFLPAIIYAPIIYNIVMLVSKII
jgi:putative ABC transport system permease protein